MNRLRMPAAAPTSSPPKSSNLPQSASSFDLSELRFESQIEEGVASSAAGEVPTTLFAPIHYEPNYAYPLLVWLHGDGQDERQLIRLMPQVSLRNYVGVAPRAPAPSATRGRGFQWSMHAGDGLAADNRVFEAIDGARRRYTIAKRRVFLAGADAGGTAALRIALAYPDRFAGAMSFGGAFPTDGTPLARLHDARRLPLFLAYDRDTVDFERSRIDRQLRLFFTAGLQVVLRQYPRHSLLGRQMLADADRWMMELVTGG